VFSTIIKIKPKKIRDYVADATTYKC
jgi:hypothetical protein